tara:strand:+ start:163 stop:573 length:411 start_codon:yes stop_codon:yes gene_type:complete
MKERELRKINKKIRHLKSKDSWEMKKIGELEKKSESTMKEITHDREKKNEISVRKAKEEKMTDDDWIDSFRSEEIPVNIDDHIIPNTRETRLLRKQVIQNIQTHILDEEVVRQLQLTRIMDSIDRIQKEQGEKEKE